MELHQLRYFVAAARSGTITRAAETLFLSQPSLSEQIRKLEREMGTALFERLGRRLALTAAGAALLPHAERALLEVEEGRLRVREVLGLQRGRIAIGTLPSVGVNLLPSVLATFRRLNPGIEVLLREEDVSLAFEGMVHGGELDMAVIRLPGTRNDLEYRLLLHEPLVAMVPVSHRLAGRLRVAVSELADEEFVATRPGHGLRELLLETCRRSGFEPRITVETGQLSILHGLVLAGVGIAVVPRLAASGQGPRLGLDDPEAVRDLAVCYRGGQPLSPPAAAFLDLLLETASGFAGD